jgi:mannose-6-phosphate isomerase-like protein (cupin superfamily)
MLAGHMHVEFNDGTTIDLGPGDAFTIPPGHDAWVAGDEPVVLLDWGGEAREFARPVDETTGGSR